MSTQDAVSAAGRSDAVTRFDVVVVGAGFSGIHMLYRMRQLGMTVRLYEAAAGVGGTWYWNRYPGAGSDIESLEYSYGFDEALQLEWQWSKRYAPQAEIEAYLNHVTDRFELRKDIVFNTKIDSFVFDEPSAKWRLQTSRGERVECRYVMMATGILSEPKRPDIPGFEAFKGEVLYTSSWPQQAPKFAGKRVGVIGTGSSAVQAIPLIAKEAGHLTVFQRTPNFAVPLRNGPLDPEYERRVKSDYKGWREKQMNSFGGYVSVNFEALPGNPNNAADVTSAQRREEFESRWKSGGLCFYTSFKDLLFNQEMNEELAEFVREKIRPRIKDPQVAETLLPKGYPILTKRLCCDTNYYETYNRDNVSLVNLREDPLEEIVEEGVRAGGKLHQLDTLIFATGFDAITGTLINLDIRGRDGRTLRGEWVNGARTNFGLMSAGFPNMFFINGPGSCTAFFNPVLNVEYQGNWIAQLLERMGERGLNCVESTPEADEGWSQRQRDVAAPSLFWKSNNWFIGANVPGKPRTLLIYLGGFGDYRERTQQVAHNGYAGFVLSRCAQADAGQERSTQASGVASAREAAT